MTASPSQSVSATLPCDLTAAGAARRLLTAECRAAGVEGDATDTAELLVSEVVTNAVIHGRSEVRLGLWVDPGVVRVEVGDDNSRHPRAQCPDAAALDGRGLTIVDTLATRWGVVDSVDGKVVWFELDV